MTQKFNRQTIEANYKSGALCKIRTLDPQLSEDKATAQLFRGAFKVNSLNTLRPTQLASIGIDSKGTSKARLKAFQHH